MAWHHLQYLLGLAQLGHLPSGEVCSLLVIPKEQLVQFIRLKAGRDEHCRRAREIASRFLDARVVLSESPSTLQHGRMLIMRRWPCPPPPPKLCYRENRLTRLKPREPKRLRQTASSRRSQPLIGFFGYYDVFEDFYPHYGVDQRHFATRWTGSGNHAFLALLQAEIGDVVWYMQSLSPQFGEMRHEAIGIRTKFLRSPWLHRLLWRAFYMMPGAWRLHRFYPAFALVASLASMFSWRLVRELLRDRPDIIFTQDYATPRFDLLVLFARLRGIRLIAYHAGGQPETYTARFAKHLSIRRSDKLIASSTAELEMLVARFGAPRDRVKVVLTPVDTKTFRPQDRKGACQLMGLPPERRYFLFIGRLDDRVKRVSALVSTFCGLTEQHADIDLLIVGDGPDGEYLRSLADSAGDRVRFLGWRSEKTELAALYNTAICMVLPSRKEGFPSVVGEALSCGIPVIASAVGAIPEMVIDGQTGWLVPPGDDAALANALTHCAESPGEIAMMRTTARKLAEARLAPEVVTGALRKLFSTP
jgi:glycosyltransferase involved in cell wall biosynthesis